METFTRLYPDRAEGLTAVDVASELPGPIPDGRPFMCLHMIATADGRATVKGRAGTIANEADYQLFHATRARMHGIHAIVCEGGPNLNATLLPAGVVDELHLVYAPKLAGGPNPLTILTGPELDPPIELELITLHESGGYLFCRYGVRVATG